MADLTVAVAEAHATGAHQTGASRRPPVRKYSDDEPRDERGRWTSGGGSEFAETRDPFAGSFPTLGEPSSVKPPAKWNADIATAIDDLNARYPDTAFDKHMALIGDPERLLPALAALDDLKSRFPNVRLDRVTFVRQQDAAYATTTYLPTADGGPTVRLGLNPFYYGDRAKGDWSSDGPGWHVDGTHNPAGTVYHEFGHAVYAAGLERLADLGAPDTAMQRLQDGITAGKMRQVSGYAYAGGGPEAFAEAFSAATDPDSRERDVPLVRDMAAYITSEHLETGPHLYHAAMPDLRKYSDDQPRDDHGRWTSDGGGYDLPDLAAAGAAYRDAAQRLFGDTPQDPYWPIDPGHEIEKGADRAVLKAQVAARLAAETGMQPREASSTLAVWARTSGDNDKDALDLQAAAKAEFGLKDTTDPWQHSVAGEAHDADQRFLRAMYNDTQADLAARGIDGLYLYRGTRYDSGPTDGVGRDGRVELQPLSSWSINGGTAHDFSANDDEPVQRLDAMYVPADRIVSTPRTGFGAANEGEVVVLGGQYDTRTVSWKGGYDGSAFGGGTGSDEIAALQALTATGKAARSGGVARLDVDLRNADWPKRTWDIFLPAKAVPPVDPHLPVYQAAPPEYRAVQKYSDEEPRDDHGRWTDGGGGAATPTVDRLGFETVAPGARVKWDGINPTYHDAIRATLKEFVQRFPAVAGRAGGVKVFASTLEPGTQAETFGNSIKLSRAWYGGPTGVWDVPKDGLIGPNTIQAGWTVDETPTGTLIHELGHVVDNDGNSGGFLPSDTIFDTPGGNGVQIKDAISGYSTTNSAENFAESFTAWWEGKDAGSPQVSAIAGWLSDIYHVTKVTKSASPLTFIDEARRAIRAAYVRAYIAGKRAALAQAGKKVTLPPKPGTQPITDVPSPDEDDASAREGYDPASEVDEDEEEEADVEPLDYGDDLYVGDTGGVSDTEVDLADLGFSSDDEGYINDLSQQQADRLQDAAAILVGGLAGVALYNAWMKRCATSVNPVYEQGFGSGAAEAGTITRATWHADGDAETCEQCQGRDGTVWEGDEPHPYPGEGTYGEICDGGPNCRCELWYELVPQEPAEGAEAGDIGIAEELGAFAAEHPAAGRAGAAAGGGAAGAAVAGTTTDFPDTLGRVDPDPGDLTDLPDEEEGDEEDSIYDAAAVADLTVLSVPDLIRLRVIVRNPALASTEDLLAASALLKYSDDQPRDDHGRWTAGAGYEGTPEQQAAYAAFATMPRTGLTTASAQKWLKGNADLYASNQTFRTLVAASSAYTQGHFGELRGAAVYGMTGQVPPPDGMNPQAWRGYITGEPWRNDFGAAPEGAKDGTIATVPTYPGMPDLGTSQYYVQDGRLTSTEEYPAPALEIAPSIMAYSAAESSGDNPAQDEKSTESVSYKDAGLALNEAIAAAPPMEGDLYRGLRINLPEGTPRGVDASFELRADGTIMAGAATTWDYETHDYRQIEGEPYLKVGQALDLVGPTSFTADDAVAERIASGRQQMGDIKPAAGDAALVFKVSNPQAINVGGVSPYRQSEWLTNGKFTIANIEKSWVPAGYNAYTSPRDRKDSIPQFTVTLKQEGTWQPPA